MHWLQNADVGLLRFINQTLSNPVFDRLMPFASGNKFFFPVVFLAGLLLLWKGRARGRVCILMLILIVWPGDTLVCNTMKHAVARPRPAGVYPDLNQPLAKNQNDMAMRETDPVADADAPRPARKISYTSMPSSHAANMFAAAMVLFVYYRRSLWFMLPLACLVSFSRIYNGVHYPSDVLAGMILGAGYAVAGLWAFNALWQWAGPKWFPLWWEKLPSLVNPETQSASAPAKSQMPKLESPASAISEPALRNPPSATNDHWLRLGYVLIAGMLIANLLYLRSGLLELTGDEAYQWLWSKHLALSYVSKPPMIAYFQFVSTHLWGDTQFGVRFWSPVISAIIGFLLLRFFAREVNARAGFFLLLILAATPLMAIGSILMTIDPLSVLFWTSAVMAGWRAVQPNAKTSAWLWVGLWMGLGFLSKYTELFLLLCWIVFFVLWKPARAHLRRPGPYLAVLINLLCTLPVLIWNQQHGWSGVAHVVDHNARLDKPWEHTTRYFFDFVASEAALLNPIFFLAMLWAAFAFWRRYRNDPRLLYFFSMGAPLVLSYLLFSFHSRILPNWIAPAVPSLFGMMVIYWDLRRQAGARVVKFALPAGLMIGLAAVLFLHETDLVKTVAGRPLPPKPDPLTRARAYSEVAKVVNEARTKLLAEGKPVFIVAGHYQLVSLLTFYLPEARTNAVANPLVFYPATQKAENQYFYWPGYKDSRQGQNALFVVELGGPPLVKGWFSKWRKGETNLLRRLPENSPPPPSLVAEFESVTDLGQFEAYYKDRVFHTIQIYECRNLR